MRLEDEYFESVACMQKKGDEVFLVLTESMFRANATLVKFDKDGQALSRYAKHGQGPGEFKGFIDLVIDGESIFVSEYFAPVLHEFDLDLNFVQDHRLEKGGRIMLSNSSLIGIWSTSYTDDKAFMMSIYKKPAFVYERSVFEVDRDDIPAFVGAYGGAFCKVDEKTWAGMEVHRFQIQLFDSHLNFQGNLWKSRPRHAPEYTAWEKDTSTVNANEVEAWMATWYKIEDLCFVDNKFLVFYTYKGQRYLDVFARNGRILSAHESVSDHYLFHEDNLFFRAEKLELEDVNQFSIVTDRFSLRARNNDQPN